MRGDPAWLKWLAGAGDPANVRHNSLKTLEKLAVGEAIGPRGMEAYAILQTAPQSHPAEPSPREAFHGQALSDFGETSAGLASHRGTWWHAKLAEFMERNQPAAQPWRLAFEQESRQLRARAIAARSSVWLLGFIGLFLIPGTLRRMAGALRAKPRGYGGAWPLPVGLTVFLVATLAWIGFTMTLELGIGSLPSLHPAAGIMLDSAARLLPAMIAIGLLFRRPSHAIRVLGANRAPAPAMILGLFSLLMIVDQCLRPVFGDPSGTEPGGSLGFGEAGLWGLAFVIVSACVLAPAAEEILYRGVLFRACWNRLGVVTAAILSSAIFAVLHFYDGYGLASVGIFGFSCALLYAATGSLSAAIAFHALYNSAIKIPEWIVYHAPLG